MTRAIVLTILMLVSAALSSVYGQRERPRLPFVDRGACPFECCVYRDWSVDKATVVRTAMRDNAPVAFRLKRGERVRGLTGTVLTTKLGELRVMKPTDFNGSKANPGDVVYLLTYQGEGEYKSWYKGKLVSPDFYETGAFKIVSQPESTWWVKVRNRRGQVGWTSDAGNFGNMDECGG